MDSLVRAVTEDHAVRFVTVVTTSLSREACRRLEAKEMEARVLSRLCTTGCMLATIAKEGHERVMINIRADGPIGRLIADAWGDGRARACLEQRLSEHEAPMDHAMTGVRPSIAHAVGTSGSLTVTRDLGLEQQYQGTVDLLSGEIDEDVEHYLNTSEQLPSVVRCATLLDGRGEVRRSAGIMAQILPGTDSSRLDSIRARLEEATLRDVLAQDRTANELALFANGGHPLKTHSSSPVQFYCPCDEDHARRVVSTLGADDLESLADEQPLTDVRCHFCGHNYALAADVLREIATTLRSKTS